MARLIQLLTHRATIMGVAILLQFGILITVILRFNRYFTSFYGLMVLLSGIAVIYIVNSNSNPAYKLAWVIPILIVPIFGGFFYVLYGNNSLSKEQKKAMRSVEIKVLENTSPMHEVDAKLKSLNPHAANQSKYIQNYSYFPPYALTSSHYYGLGERFFEALKNDLRKANHYIFMEYFIVAEGTMWDEILEILLERIHSGVKVRLLYDDIGCLLTLPRGYDEKLRKMGLEVAVFNPLKPLMSAKYNTRDHRKITVIDGIVGYTGGINLADEYINLDNRLGHWKDSAIRLEGDAVWSLTVMFLSLWDFIKGIDEDYAVFKPRVNWSIHSITPDGIVQPFTDDPLDNEPVGASIYLNLIQKAKEFVYIKTPYLIIDNELFMALSIAAKSGLDVRIITPGVPDKWYVHMTTQSYYEMLIRSGVKIYEYTPGFIHEKTFVVDDEFAVIGTVNLDYRSLYLHYECGVWVYGTESVQEMKLDFMETLKKCTEISLEATKAISKKTRFVRALLRFFAPLM